MISRLSSKIIDEYHLIRFHHTYHSSTSRLNIHFTIPLVYVMKPLLAQEELEEKRKSLNSNKMHWVLIRRCDIPYLPQGNVGQASVADFSLSQASQYLVKFSLPLLLPQPQNNIYLPSFILFSASSYSHKWK